MRPYWATGHHHGDLNWMNTLRRPDGTLMPIDPSGNADSPEEDLANWLMCATSDYGPADIDSLPDWIDRRAVATLAAAKAQHLADERLYGACATFGTTVDRIGEWAGRIRRHATRP